MLMVLSNILLVISIGMIILMLAILIRNNRVYNHRHRVIDKIHNRNVKAIEDWGNAIRSGVIARNTPLEFPMNYDILDEVSYGQQVWQFWRLDFDSFFPEEYRVGKA